MKTGVKQQKKAQKSKDAFPNTLYLSMPMGLNKIQIYAPKSQS